MAAPDLRDRLAELEVEHATLQSELEAFHAEYLRRVGVIDVQVQALQARLARDTPEADAAARRYRESTAAMAAVPAPAAPSPPSEDLKTLFRDAAKRMHPDLQPDEAGRGHAEAFMKQLNQAYTAGDADAIGNLVRQWETSPYAVASAGRGPAPALTAAVEQAEARLAATRNSRLAQLMEQTFLASMQGRDLLQELRWNAEEELANTRLRVTALDG